MNLIYYKYILGVNVFVVVVVVVVVGGGGGVGEVIIIIGRITFVMFEGHIVN